MQPAQTEAGAVYPGHCAHGNNARVCAAMGLCRVEEVEALEEWWALTDDPEMEDQGGRDWLMVLVGIVWFGFGVMMFITLCTAIASGQVRQASVSAALFAFMACGAYGWGKVR